MVKQCVKVFIRTRPTTKFAQNVLKITPQKRKIDVHIKHGVGESSNKQQTYNFQYHGILHNASQEEVFSLSCTEIIDSVLEGYNGTVFCYGQTGAGKTYTMTGPPDQTANFQRRGVIPRAIEYIFQEVHNRPEKSYKIGISYLEIYNEKLFDLLSNSEDNSDIRKDQKSLKIIELSKDRIFVRNLKRHPVRDEEEALSLMFEGESQRAICEHILNEDSSRSHCVFTIHLEMRSRVESSGQKTFSKLHLIDLAGSERIKKTKSSGRVLNEAKFINKSLTFLEQVVIALSTPKRSHVPYRQSQLTHLLTDSIGGNSKTTMIANIWGEGQMIEETLSTLKFSSRMLKVQNNAVINIEMNPGMLIKQYERQVRELKRELAMHDQLKGITEVTYDEYTEEQRVELRKKLLRYCREEIDELEVKNLRQVKEAFQQFRTIVQNLQTDLRSYEKAKKSDLPNVDTPSSSSGEKDSKSREGATKKTKKRVGKKDENGFAFGSGIPAKKFSGRKDARNTPKHTGRSGAAEEESEPSGELEIDAKPVMSKNEAYERYKIEQGREQFENVRKNIEKYNARKKEITELSERFELVKREVSEVKDNIESKKQQSRGSRNDQVLDSEHQLMYTQLKEKKNEYRNLVDERKSCRKEINYLSNVVNLSRKKLIQDFEVFYSENYKFESDKKTQKVYSSRSRGSEHDNGQEDDKLDDAEMFERLEERRMRDEDPNSYMFYKAFKKSKIKVKRKRRGRRQ